MGDDAGRSRSSESIWGTASSFRVLVRAVIPLVAFVVIWQLIAQAMAQPRLFPPVGDIAGEIGRILRGESTTASSSYVQALATSRRALVAFSISFVVGSLAGIVAGRSRYLFNLASTLMWPVVAVPAIVWAFIFLIVMGISEAVPVSAVAILLTPLVLVHVAEGTKSLPAELEALMDAYKIDRWRRLVDVYVPYLVPYLVSSARVTFAITLKIIFVVEVVGLATGIGYDINYWYNSIFLAPVVAWGVLTVLVGLTIDYTIFGPLERRLTRGRSRPETNAEAVALQVE